MAKLVRRTDDEWVCGMTGGRHWRAEDAARVLGVWERGGTSIAAFARRCGLNPKRLYWWRERLSRREATAAVGLHTKPPRAEAAMRFVEVRVAATTPPGGDAGVVVEVGAHVRIAVSAPDRVDPAWLARVVAQVAAEADA